MYLANLPLPAFDTDADALDAFARACADADVHPDAAHVARRTDTRAFVAFDATRNDVTRLVQIARVRVTLA